MIYFLIQSIASILLLFSFIIILHYKSINIILFISIIIKIGRAPFHYWIPIIIEGINWLKIFILLTWQKINPLIILYFNNYFNLINIFILLSLIIGSISGLNYSSIKKIISFSSINQLRWIIIRLINNKLLKLYLIFYFFTIWIIIKSIILFNIKYLNEIYNLNIKNKFIKLFIFINFLSLGGLPPFLGFFPKLIIIIKINNLFILFFIIVITLITLFIYLRIILSIIILNSLKTNKIKKIINNNNFINITLFILFINLSLILILFLN